jgi:hypothetical protein
MRKILVTLAALFALAAFGAVSRAEDVAGSRPKTSRFVMQLDSELNFNVTMQYSDLAGGAEKSTIYIMIAFQQGEALVAYDVFPLKVERSAVQEVQIDGKAQGKLEFSVLLSRHTDVRAFDDVLDIRMFLVDAQGRKSKTKSWDLDVTRIKDRKGQLREI